MTRVGAKTIHEALGREPVHPFPARMAPGIALEVLAEAKRPLRVLDPMMGSGTVLAVARAKGHKAVGVDIDPLSVLISRVWTTPIDPDEIREKAIQVLDRARAIFATLSVSDAYPRYADLETRKFVVYWFDDYSRRQLTALATAIARVQDESVCAVLWCGFSRLIITKQAGASLAMDLAHSRPHKAFDRAPSKPFRKFLAAVERVVMNCLDVNQPGLGPTARAYEGDARKLHLHDSSIDLVLTSPPYLNAIDYMRCSKFSLVWMGHSIGDLRRLRAASVGTEVGNDHRDDKDVREIFSAVSTRAGFVGRDAAILAGYIADMLAAVQEVARVLTPGGRAVYVVGENTVRGAYIRNSIIVSMVAALCGLTLVKRRVRALPANRRYLPPPSRGRGQAPLDARIRREVLLDFKLA
jgi:SAM-dependent methyltransferase